MLGQLCDLFEDCAVVVRRQFDDAGRHEPGGFDDCGLPIAIQLSEFAHGDGLARLAFAKMRKSIDVL